MSVGLRAGYKQTEVGVIPEDWDVRQMVELCEYQNGTSLEHLFTTNDGLKVISIGNYSATGNYIDNGVHINRQHRKQVEKFVLKRNDLTMSLNDKTSVGTIIGRVLLIQDDDIFVFNQRTMRLRPKSNISPSYLHHTINADRVHSTIVGLSKPGTQIYVNTDDVLGLKLPVPPLPEQRAIAAALGDMDALLGGLDRLIAKKLGIKVAAMQQLLTGQTRLPGFSGAWEVKRLGDLFKFSGGYSASRDQLSVEGHCYLHYGDIHGASKTTIDTKADYQDIPKLDIPLKRVSPDSLLADGDVVFVDASEDDAGTSKHVVVVNKGSLPFIAGLHTIVAKAKTAEFAHKYLQYCFQTPAVREQFMFYAVGTKVSGISKTNIAKLTVPVPSVPEQTAIATILSDMDAELAALQARRAKTQALKQAMMQELLTGRIRLV